MDEADQGPPVLARVGLEQVAQVTAKPGEPFDLAWDGWLPDYFDPESMLRSLIDDRPVEPPLVDAAYQRKLAGAARLSGPARFPAFGNLDVDLARNAEPLAAYGNIADHDFFSARIGCQTSGVYGIDLAALCLRPAPG